MKIFLVTLVEIGRYYILLVCQVLEHIFGDTVGVSSCRAQFLRHSSLDFSFVLGYRPTLYIERIHFRSLTLLTKAIFS